MVPFLENNRHLQVFKLNNNGLGIWGGTVVAKALLENAKKSKAAGEESNLKTVVCGRNRLENGSAPYFAEAFAAHGNLVEVRLPQNGIRMEGIHALAQGLSKCSKLESLDLQDNTCTESGTRSISASLPSWPELRTLNLSDCLLSPKGGVSLATALEKGANPKIETLKLQYGEMDARAIHILAKAIQEHLSSLTTLELNGNRADPEDECIERIKDALASHGHEDALDEREYGHETFPSIRRAEP
jgi:Ran GTPase-activating protein 1